MSQIRWIDSGIWVMILVVGVSLSGCDYLLPPGGWEPGDPQVVASDPPEGSPPESSIRDPNVVKARQQMLHVLRKLRDQRSPWLRKQQDAARLPVGLTRQLDFWGTPYRVWPEIRFEGPHREMRIVMVLASAGPDGEHGSADDIQMESASFSL